MREHGADGPPAGEAPDFDEPGALAQLVAEGMLIMSAATRLAVSNQAIVRTLREHADFDSGWYAGAVRRELTLLADEKAEDAARVAAELAHAIGRKGRAGHQSDYRQVDVRHLRQRRAMLESLVAELRERERDPEFVEQLARASRRIASDEVRGAIRNSALRSAPPADLLSADERAKRMAELRRDLARLLDV